jgi:nucleotide-binding universal stress UspA family protein
MVTSKAIAHQNGCIAYGIRPAPKKIAVCAVVPAEEKPMGIVVKGAEEKAVPLYVFLREKAMGKSPQEKRELLAALVEMAEKKGINLQQFLRAIEIGQAEYHEILERVDPKIIERV